METNGSFAPYGPTEAVETCERPFVGEYVVDVGTFESLHATRLHPKKYPLPLLVGQDRQIGAIIGGEAIQVIPPEGSAASGLVTVVADHVQRIAVRIVHVFPSENTLVSPRLESAIQDLHGRINLLLCKLRGKFIDVF